MSHKAERGMDSRAIRAGANRKVMIFAGSLALLLSVQRVEAAPRAGVLAEELAQGSRVTATVLTRELQRGLALLGFDCTPQHTLVLYGRRFRPQQLLVGQPPAKLSKVLLDVALAARLTVRSHPPGSYEGHLELRVVEVATRRVLAAFSGRAQVKATTLSEGRDRARLLLLKRADKQLRPALELIGRGRGQVLLYLDRQSLPLEAQRFAARLADLQEIREARLVSLQGRRAVFAVRPAGSTDVKKALARRLGLIVEGGRQLAWWGRMGSVPGRIAVTIAKVGPGDGLTGVAQELASRLVARALDNSLRLHRAPAGSSGARTLHVSLTGGQLRARIDGAPALTAEAPLSSPRALAAAAWQLARELDAAAGRSNARLAALPALDRLRFGATLTSFDLLGALAGTGKLEGVRGKPTVTLGGMTGQLRASLPGYSKTVQSVPNARKVALALPLDADKLAALRRPEVAVLRLELTFGKGTERRRDRLDLPLPLWSRQLIDRKQEASLTSLIDVQDEIVRARLGRALMVARELDGLRPLEQGLWLPLCAYGVLQAAKLKITPPPPGAGRLRWQQLPGTTLRRGRGSRADLTIALATLLAAGGARTKLWRQRDGSFLLAVDTGWAPGAAGLAELEARRLTKLEGTLWLPLAVDTGRSFEDAWTRGAKQMAALGARRRRAIAVEPLPATLASGQAGSLDEAPFREVVGGAAQAIVQRQKKRLAAILKAAKLGDAPIGKRLGVARALLRLRGVAKARQLLEGYLVLKEKDQKAQLLLAVSYAYQGAFQLAREHFDKAKGANARLGSGISSALLGDKARALAALRGHGAVAQQLGLKGKKPRYLQGDDPAAAALSRIAGSDNLRLREKLLGQRSGPDRRFRRRALDLLRY